MNTRINRTLLAAAALIGATSSVKAYDLYDSGWDYSQPSFSYGSYFVGDGWTGREYSNLTDDRSFPFFNVTERDLVNAGVYRGIAGSFSWSGNEYESGGGAGGAAYVYGVLETGLTDGEGGFAGVDADFDGQSGFYTNGTFNFDTTDTTTNLAIGQTSYSIYMDVDGNYFGAYVSGGLTVYERTVQVARTGSGFDGADDYSAFQSDNSLTLSGTYYGPTIAARNVLPLASQWSDGEGGYGPDLAGSVVKLGDIALGFLESEGLFAKDGGWLDIRGDLTLGAGGTIYIRDGEITSNIYTQFYAPGTLTEAGSLAIESGILSVRSHFAQDMVAVDGQTLGFRDGAVNNTRLILTGFGYGFDAEGGWGDASNGGGALRSISGNNIQNGNISIVGDGDIMLDGAAIGVDAGATLTINGTINGLNSLVSDGGAAVGFNAVGNATLNGRILAGITDVIKAGSGELLINSSNLFTGDVEVIEGSLRITNSGALSGTSGQTYVSSGASLVLDQASGLSLADDIHINGTGATGIGGALHNKSGANATTGNLWVGTGNGSNSSATVKVDASTSLTVSGLRSYDGYNTLTLDVGGASATAGSFTATGNTGALDYIIKNGTGNATLTTLSADLNDIDVNAGNLLVLGSESSALNIFDELDIDGTQDLLGKPVGSLELRGTHHYIELNIDMVDVLIKGSVTHHGGELNDLDINGNATVTIDVGATLTTEQNEAEDASADIENGSKLVVKGTFQANGGSIIDLDDEATLDIRTGGIVNSDVIANQDSTVEVASGGVLNGDVEIYNDATLILHTGAVHNGDYDAYGNAVVTINGSVDNNEVTPLGQNFGLSGSARLQGSGTIGGNLTQTGGTVAPGNSPGILSVLGNYTNTAGVLDLELAGTGAAGTAYDQLRVTGTITVSNALQVDYSVIRFTDFAGFEADHGDVFQVIANASGNARNTFDKFDLSQTVTTANDRVLFNHATGKAYGTGLTTSQNFSHYARNRNQAEIGRALWMEAIDFDKSGISGELPQSFIDTAFDGEGAAAKAGLKAWILTRHDAVLGELGTDLGAAAVQMLTAASGAEGLDSLSPEAYSGFSELAVRLNRNIALIGATARPSGDSKKWGFNLGYTGEQVSSNSTSGYTSYKASSDTAHLSADVLLGTAVRLNLVAGLDDGRVTAREFSGDTNTAVFGIGLGITPESKFARFDIGASFSTTDFDAVRQGSFASEDNQDAYAVAARVTFLPKDPSIKDVAEGKGPKLSLIPYVGVSYATADIDGLTEANVPGSAQLNVDAFKRRSLVGELGLNAEYALGENTTLTGVLAYEHDFRNGGGTDMTAEFADDGVDDTDFSIRTDGLGSSIFRLGVGFRQKLGAKASLGFGYDALLGSGITSGQQVKADLSFRF